MELTLDELFEQIKKIPDWERFPWPEAFYKHFNVKKLQPAGVNEAATYFPPPHIPLGDGKVEIRGPVPGGVREVEFGAPLPVEVKLITDESESETKQDSAPTTWSLPTADNNSNTQLELGRQ